MKIGDKAEESPEISLARQSAPGVYRLLNDELVPADELTAEGEFPEYGDFLKVETTTGGAEPSWNREEYIECPQALAQWLVEHQEIASKKGFRIRTVQKVDGAWQYECEVLSNEDAAALADEE